MSNELRLTGGNRWNSNGDGIEVGVPVSISGVGGTEVDAVLHRLVELPEEDIELELEEVLN